MIVLAILATLASLVWTILMFFANGMSDSPGGGFEGTWSIGGAWLVTAVLWVAWWLG